MNEENKKTSSKQEKVLPLASVLVLEPVLEPLLELAEL